MIIWSAEPVVRFVVIRLPGAGGKMGRAFARQTRSALTGAAGAVARVTLGSVSSASASVPEL